MICGSHHLVLLSKQGPKDKSLDLNSVLFISPRGSTIPLTLYEDLQVFFPNLAAIFQGKDGQYVDGHFLLSRAFVTGVQFILWKHL